MYKGHSHTGTCARNLDDLEIRPRQQRGTLAAKSTERGHDATVTGEMTNGKQGGGPKYKVLSCGTGMPRQIRT